MVKGGWRDGGGLIMVCASPLALPAASAVKKICIIEWYETDSIVDSTLYRSFNLHAEMWMPTWNWKSYNKLQSGGSRSVV